MKITKIEPHKSSLGLDANIAILIIYIAMAVVSWVWMFSWVAWAVPIVFFFLEKESKFVKFQAVQAFIIGLVRAGIAFVFQIFIWILTPRGYIGGLFFWAAGGWGARMLLNIFSTLIAVAITLIILFLIIKAYKYEHVELPVIGPIAAKINEKLDTFNTGQPMSTAAPSTFCPHCGTPMQNGMKFCGSCGKEIT